MPKNAKTSSTAAAPNHAPPSIAPVRDQTDGSPPEAQNPLAQNPVALPQVAEDRAPDPIRDQVPAPPRQTKAALVRQMLLDPQGATLHAMIAATGWQAHTVRAALSGQRKAGLTITRLAGDEHPRYLAVVVPGAAPPAAPATTAIRNDASVAARRPARRRTASAQNVERYQGTTTVGTDDGRADAEATPLVQS